MKMTMKNTMTMKICNEIISKHEKCEEENSMAMKKIKKSQWSENIIGETKIICRKSWK